MAEARAKVLRQHRVLVREALVRSQYHRAGNLRGAFLQILLHHCDSSQMPH